MRRSPHRQLVPDMQGRSTQANLPEGNSTLLGHQDCGSESHRGARCGKTARRDLCGGRRATGVPTATVLGQSNKILQEVQCMAKLAERITVDPEQCGGRPCIRGMRIRVTDVLDLLANGLTATQVLEELPDLAPEDIQACLRFASQRLNHPVVVA